MRRLLKKAAGGLLLFTGILLVGNSLWIKGKPLLAEVLLRSAWERTVKNSQPVKAWPWADSRPVARIRVARLGVDLIVLEGDSGEVLAFGPGHVSGSARPLGKGNCVLVGHRDTSFTFLKDLRIDDTIIIHDEKNRSGTYQVQSTTIALADELHFREPSDAWLTLITCFPFDAISPGTDKRYVVFAGLMDKVH